MILMLTVTGAFALAEDLPEGLRLKEPVVDPANEGVRVIASGPVDIRKQVTDKEIGIDINTVYAYREVRMLTKVNGEWTWQTLETDIPGVPKSETFVGEAWLGDFRLDSSVVRELPADHYLTKEMLSEKDLRKLSGRRVLIEENGVLWVSEVSEDVFRFKADDIAMYEGAFCFTYRVFDPEQYPEITVAALQSGASLVRDVTLPQTVFVRDESKAMEWVKSGTSLTIIIVAFAVLVVVIVIITAVVKRRKKRPVRRHLHRR